ncbi:MAG TPA: DUF72 domain-containing protein [Anaeromyxobacteraceae bacterium]|nr:DUF72 domain-containing protein [Anaeromyxobacteraceae bacterium]
MRILAGTSGYSYAPWKGIFYPPRLPSSRMLAFYASRLPAVEINATFYRMPSAATLDAWRSRVPEGFRFALKGSRRITHVLRLGDVGAPLARFQRAAGKLGGALGPVLWQLPPDMKKDAGRLAAFLALLPHGRSVFEFRHPSWLDDEILRLLSGAGAALCVTETEEGVTPLAPTARFGYLRLRRSDYGDAALAAWLDRVRSQPWEETWVFFRHEDTARGPAFALRLAALARAGAQPADHPAIR